MKLLTLQAALGALSLTLGLAADLLVADFERGDYGDWKVEGKAFGSGPAKGGVDGQMQVSGFLGERLVNSFHGGDASIGKLTSPEFKIERPFINFLIGGGGHKDQTGIKLLVDGEVVRSSTGANTAGGGSEALEWESWDVREFAGMQASIEIIDAHSGGWGHLNIDHIVQGEHARGAVPASRTFTAAKRYLYLPVATGAKQRRLKLMLGDRPVREMDVELALDGKVSLTAAVDLSRWQGEELTLELGKIDQGKPLPDLVQSDELPGADTIYQEKFRPLFHFTSKIGWLNDPNGLVYDDGEWHLYYQHNPYGWNWGNMHWGHAVSTNLFHWKEIGDAIYPWSDCVGAAFSGSATIDRHNTSGWGKGVLVAALTDTGAGESIAYSTDRGRSFAMFDGNPVVKHQGRDPKVIWHEASQHWVMALYSDIDKVPCVAFYNSKDLKQWEYQSHLEGYFECPDLFELPVDGDKNNTRWVVYAADAKYSIGQFDGKVFTPEHEGKHQLWYGNFYAAQTYDNAPDGRRIQIGWGRGITFPGMPFNQQMAVPVELTLHQIPAGVRMRANPVRELEALREGSELLPAVKLLNTSEAIAYRGEALDLTLRITPTGAESVGLRVRGCELSYHPDQSLLMIGDLKVPIALEDGSLHLRILVDRGSVEVFANGGSQALQVGQRLDPESECIEVFARGGAAEISEFKAHRFRSSWE